MGICIEEKQNIHVLDSVSAAGIQHRHEGLADLLQKQEVEVVIVGGIGQGAIDGLSSRGLKVLYGASGSIKTSPKHLPKASLFLIEADATIMAMIISMAATIM